MTLVFYLFLSLYKCGWVLWDRAVCIQTRVGNVCVRKMHQVICAAQKCWYRILFSWLVAWLFPGSWTWAFLSQTFNQRLLMNLLLHLQMNKGRKINISAQSSKSTWTVYGKCQTKTCRKTIHRQVTWFAKVLLATSSYIGITLLYCSTSDLFCTSFSATVVNSLLSPSLLYFLT